MANPYNLGFGFYGGHDCDTVMKLVKASEDNDFASVWIAEDYFYGGAFSTAAACAVQTSKIQIGIGVINPFTRHPVLSAMESASLDAISKGRIILGLGGSNKRWMEDMAGIPFKKPIQSTKECAMIIKELIGKGHVKFDGEVFKTGDVELDFVPYRKDLPVYLGVKGPKALHIAGQIADGVLLSTMTSLPYVAYAKEHIAAGAKEAGRDPSEIKISAYFPMHVDKDSKKAKQAVKEVIAKFVGIHGVHPILTCTGMTEEQIMPFKEGVLKGKFATELVTDEMVDLLAIAGDPDECKAKLTALNEAGVDNPVAFEVMGIDPMESLQIISKYVLD